MIGSVSGEEQSFIETGQPWRCHLAHRHELQRARVKADIGIMTLWHRQGNNLINCTEMSLMNSYVVISTRSNSRMSFSFLMGQHSCTFGIVPILVLFFPPLSFWCLLAAWLGTHMHTYVHIGTHMYTRDHRSSQAQLLTPCPAPAQGAALAKAPWLR